MDANRLHFGPWLVLLALLVAGCVGSDDTDDGGTGDGDGSGGGGGGGGVEVPSVAFADRSIGSVLVDGDGRTLYIFTNDDPGVSNCFGGCATNWPPLLSDAVPDAPAEVRNRLGLVERGDDLQVAYEDRPLYYFAADEAIGDVRGDGLNGVWFVVRPPPANSEMLEGRGAHAVDAGPVTYFQDMVGHLAVPADAEPSLGIVVVHEWWGLNDHIRDMADQLASHGYAVLAVDLFHGSVAQTSQEAQAQVQALDQDDANANMRAAAQRLRDEGAPAVAGLGWCFGGGQSLQLALSGETLAGTVIYYGFLVNDTATLSAIDWPVLGIFGEDDTAIPVDDVRAFEAGLDGAEVENTVLIYPDVGHAFANPSGASWAPEQTQDAWLRTLGFLEDVAG